jgi:release factor glutamine methyltransferase
MDTWSETPAGTSPAATAADLLRHASSALAAAGIVSARLDAEVLLASACGIGRATLCARLREPVAASSSRRFAAMLGRRAAREPLQYIVGHQEFWSLDFTLTPDVLIPRPETEILVEETLRELRRRGRTSAPTSLCDVGTGSGCVAVALARELPRATLYALDLSPAALRVAALNVRRHGVAGRVQLVVSDLFAAVAGVRFDAIVANPPYVASADVLGAQPELRWEPRTALDGGADGLAVIGRLLRDAGAQLAPGGVLVMEIGAAQAEGVTVLARAAGWADVSIRTDYAGLPRVVVAER